MGDFRVKLRRTIMDGERSPGDRGTPFDPPAVTGSRQVPWQVVALCLSTLAALHFLLIVVWLLPTPRVPTMIRAVASAYVTPIFAQNWWLFAPDPPRLERRVDVRAFPKDGEHDAATAWMSLTDPVIDAIRRNRLSPQNGAWIVLLNAMYSLTDERAGPLRLGGGARDLVLRTWADPARQPTGLVVLHRAGSAALAAAHPGRDFDRVQVRIAIRRLPAFADRHAAAALVDVLLFPPVPFARDVAPWRPDR
jgi:hypothetical protein